MKCIVITPVGPGHEALARECRQSVERAWRTNPGRFSAVEHLLIDDTRGALGRSRARNEAVQEAQRRGAEWIFFLDADDVMVPTAFAAVAEHVGDHDAIWGNIAELSADGAQAQLRVPQILTMNRAAELMLLHPFRTLQMGHFVRAAVAARHPFDVAMNTGEDFDYYLRVWSAHACRKIPAILFANRRGQHSTGPRAATGRDWSRAVTDLISRWCRETGTDPQSDASRRIVNAKSIEYRDYLRERDVRPTDAYLALSRALPFHGDWTVDCYDPPPFAMHSLNDDLVVASMMWIGTYQGGPMAAWLRLAARAAGDVVDVGAYTGVFALAAARRNPANRVACVEPHPEVAARLHANVTRNRLDNVSVFATAADAQAGETVLNVFTAGDWLPWDGSTSATPAADAKSTHRVAATTIDAVAHQAQMQRVSLVKISAEANPIRVWEGMTQVLDRDHPDILFWARADHPAAGTLTKRGYAIHAVGEAGMLTPTDGAKAVPEGKPLALLATVKSADDLQECGLAELP